MTTDVLESHVTDNRLEPASDPATHQRWDHRALALLLVATALLYLWGLGASGWANAYQSAAVQAGSQSRTALCFGSSDAANAITVDKTPDGGSNASQEIAAWVAENFAGTTVDGGTVHDLTA